MYQYLQNIIINNMDHSLFSIKGRTLGIVNHWIDTDFITTRLIL